MQPSSEGTAPPKGVAAILRTLRSERFEKISDIPAVPTDGRGRIHYADHTWLVRAAGDPSEAEGSPHREPWSLRSFGTNFDLLLRQWPRLGMSRCYSLGWGLYDGEQRPDLLLIQAVGSASDVSRLADALAPSDTSSVRWAVSLGEFQGYPSLRAAAVSPVRVLGGESGYGGPVHA